jgi:hypothetical protein
MTGQPTSPWTTLGSSGIFPEWTSSSVAAFPPPYLEEVDFAVAMRAGEAAMFSDYAYGTN